jgi:hypothetical protein
MLGRSPLTLQGRTEAAQQHNMQFMPDFPWPDAQPGA